MNWRNSGFTLIEIIMVLAIMAVIGTISLPRFDRVIEDYKLKIDARQLATVLRSARQEAIMTGNDQKVLFKRNLNCYIKSGTTHATYTLSRNITFTADGCTFKEHGGYPVCGFAPSGAVKDQAGKITLANKYGKRTAVVVNPSAGRVRIEEY
ncbi:MAG: GspH/FimT family pseudopilin [Syntrophomonadaceae bacterium]|nr:prepilin-type N-terminal cleavage/methylation domain-containing protein [Syntrophomonadaceae bacterium]MDD3898869.1 prepilin-type N-terminal cleavage/methylation domain-containing protein [Syntrophomonadaceae bacterium]